MATTHDYVTKADLERMLTALGTQLERELDKRIHPVVERLDALESRFDKLDAKVVALSVQVAGIDQKVDALSVQVAGIDQKAGELVEWTQCRPSSANF